MKDKVKRLLILILILTVLMGIGAGSLYASNYKWVQSDWSGGADTGASAQHPLDQSGWNKFYSKDTYSNTSIPGEISLFFQPTAWTQTGDILDFNMGTLSNLMIVGNGNYLTTRYEETNPSVTKTGTWSTATTYNPSGGTYLISNTAGSSVSFTFTGSGVSWIGVKCNSCGNANVYVDNILKGTVDLYNGTVISKQVLWSISGISNTSHTIKIVVAGTKNTNSSGFYVGVDAFDVQLPNPDLGAYITFVDGRKSWTQTGDISDFDRGILTNVKIIGTGTYGTSRYEETSPSVTNTGTWTTSTAYNPSGGTYLISNTAGSAVSFTFTGTGVSWIGVKCNSCGYGRVYLDNILKGTLDLYNSTVISQQVLWSISGISNASHTIKIEVTGGRNASSIGSYIGVDAFDVQLPNPDPGAYLMLVDGAPSGIYESPSLDTGAGGAQFFSIAWNSLVPAGSSLKFQIAANNDNLTWNFVGPDGTVNTYYETTGTSIYSGHNGSRYIKYKAFFDRVTLNTSDSPILYDITINYGLLSTLHGTYESPSFDVGIGGGFFTSITWNAVVPTGASIKFQIATNNDNATWNFVGPDGTASTYYVASGDSIYPGHNGDRYIKFKALFDRPTVNPTDNPVLNDITINYGLNPSSQSLISSPFDTTDSTNILRRWTWSENLQNGTDIVFQMRTSPEGLTWGPWYGPHSTTFSAATGVTQITVANAGGFSVGGRVSLTNSANPAQAEMKKITAINTNTGLITLDTATSYIYSAASIFTDTYTDPAGRELVNSAHRSGSDDRWFQYRVFLFTIYGAVTPTLLESRIDYAPAVFVYQPDGLIEGSGDNVYGAVGTGGGGNFTKNADPGFRQLQPITYDLRVQNDGSVESVDDTMMLSWNTPSDVSGNWTVYLNDGTSDLTSPVSVPLNSGAEKTYTLKVTPSSNAPGDSVQDIIIDTHSGNDYIKVDSVKASVHVNKIFQADGLIEGNGDNVYDPANGGTGGISVQKEGVPGETIQYSITLQNEGNTSDMYKISLLQSPPPGWKVLINDGSKDNEITNPSNGWTTPSIRSLPYSDSVKTYTLKVIPNGAPITAGLILSIYSNGGTTFLDSLTAKVKLNAIYKVDGIINSYTISGGGCGTASSGDNVYGVTGSGNGGCTGIDIPAGTAKNITLGIQNEGNVPDKYQISWNTPPGWGVVMQETRNDGSTIEYNSTPLTVPTPLSGNPSNYNPGEVPFFTFKITPPSGFVAGSPAQTIIFDIKSIGDNTKVDSVKAVVNSSDTTPPSAVVLTPGSITTKSIKISWTAPGDDGTSGTASSYDIRISSAPFTTDAVFNNAEKVKSCKTGESTPGKPKSSGSSESCTVSGLFADTDYYFALKSTDDAGNTSAISTCTACPAHTLVSGDAIPPGTVTDLSVTGSSKDTITLCWTAKADDGSDISSDTVTVYDLRYSRRKIVEDSVTPGVGEVKFSNAAILIPSGGFLPPKSSGMKECYIVPVENKINLGGGIIDDRTQNTKFYFAVKALDEARNKSSISNVAGGMTTLTPNAYNMVSVPSHPVVPDDTPVAVFGDDVGAQLYLYGWASSGANWNNGCYNGWPLPNNVGSNVCTQLTSVKEGRGYFLWTPSASISIDVPASSTVPALQDCTDDTLPVPVHFQCYVVPLQDGWNMIGPPFDKEINFSSRDIGGIIERGLYIRKTTGAISEVAKFQTAATSNNWIDGSVYTFNGTNYAFETCSQDGAGESLGTQCILVFQPWKAYWIRVHGGGGSTFELLVPW